MVGENAPCFFRSLAEHAGETVAQRGPRARLRLGQGPLRHVEGIEHGVHGFGDDRPVVDQGIVPVEQDRARCCVHAWPSAIWTSMRWRNSLVTRPTSPPPTGWPSRVVTGIKNPLLLVRNASLASRASARLKGRCSKVSLRPSMRPSTERRTIPARMAWPSGRVTSRPPAVTIQALV